jgi:hypothetical protein
MAFLIVEVIPELELILYPGLGEVMEKARPLLGHGVASEDDFSAYLTT